MNLIKQKQENLNKVFKIDDVDLVFTKCGIDEIAKTAFDLDVGARGLRRIIEKILEDYIYCIDDYKNKKIEVTKEIVYNKLNRKIAL